MKHSFQVVDVDTPIHDNVTVVDFDAGLDLQSNQDRHVTANVFWTESILRDSVQTLRSFSRDFTQLRDELASIGASVRREAQRKSRRLRQQLPDVTTAWRFVRQEVGGLVEQLDGARSYVRSLFEANDVYVRSAHYVLRVIADHTT